MRGRGLYADAMPTTRKRGASVAVATLGLLLSGALSGCSISKDDEPEKPDPTAAAEPTPTETDEPTETPTPTPSPTTATATPAPEPGTPQAALLSGAELPPLNESLPWADGKTDVPGVTTFGLCQQFDILSIGAMNALERSFTATSGDTAGQQVAEFPDAQNTVRGSKVLEAWRGECRKTLRETSSKKYKDIKVGALTPVAVPQGKGWYYIVSYTLGGEGHFHEFGVVYLRNKMTMLKMDHAGQDHNYEPGQDPMELAVKAASAKMG